MFKIYGFVREKNNFSVAYEVKGLNKNRLTLLKTGVFLLSCVVSQPIYGHF